MSTTYVFVASTTILNALIIVMNPVDDYTGFSQNSLFCFSVVLNGNIVVSPFPLKMCFGNIFVSPFP